MILCSLYLRITAKSVIINPKFLKFIPEKEIFSMAQPKKQSSPRKTGMRRSHLVLKLARRVNASSPVKVRTTKRETGKALSK